MFKRVALNPPLPPFSKGGAIFMINIIKMQMEK